MNKFLVVSATLLALSAPLLAVADTSWAQGTVTVVINNVPKGGSVTDDSGKPINNVQISNNGSTITLQANYNVAITHAFRYGTVESKHNKFKIWVINGSYKRIGTVTFGVKTNDSCNADGGNACISPIISSTGAVHIKNVHRSSPQGSIFVPAAPLVLDNLSVDLFNYTYTLNVGYN